jgi:hypothetical protein
VWRAFLFAYVTQLVLFTELNGPAPHKRHTKFLYLAIILLVLSLGAFGLGAWQAVERFR